MASTGVFNIMVSIGVLNIMVSIGVSSHQKVYVHLLESV